MDIKEKILEIQKLINLNQFTKAIVNCEKLIKKFPDNSYFYNLYGLVLQNSGNIKKSIKYFEKALVFQQDNFAAMNNLANSYKSLYQYKDSENLVALAYALENDDKRMFKLLIDNGADPKVKILNKSSLLIFYVAKNRYLLIDDIIKSGVDIDSQDKMGMTALMHSIEKINLNAVNVLVMKDFDREKTDFAGKTIFDYSNLSRNTIIRKIIETLNPTN